MQVSLKKRLKKIDKTRKLVYDTSVLYSANGGMNSGYGSSLVTDKSIARNDTATISDEYAGVYFQNQGH